MLLLMVAFLSLGQDIRPIGCTNIQSPSWSVNLADGSLYIWKNSTIGFTKVLSADLVQAKIDSLATAKQDTITLTTGGTGAATFDGQNLNIPIYSGVVSDATTTTKGIIQLAGDLSGTSASPTVPALSLKAPLTLFDSIQTGYIPYWNGAKFKSSLLYTNGTKIGINNISLEYDFQVGSGSFSGYNTVGLNASTGIPSIYFGKLGSYIGYDYAGNERMIFNSRYVNSHYEFRINDIEKVRIQNDGSVVINGLSGTGDRNVIALSDGTLSVTATSANNLINTPQELSGTTITYDASLGVHANITLSGNTTINMSNVQAGMVGNITIINDGTARTITFTGYTFKISLKIRGGTNMAWSSATGFDKFSWDYDGTRLTITGEYNIQ